MSPMLNEIDFNARVRLKSGLMLRVRESAGVMTIGFLQRPVDTEKFLGILGIPDNDVTNDFTAANGTVLNVTKYTSLSSRYEFLFDNFGKSWMVTEKQSSLFKALTGSNDFHDFNFPDYRPSFEYIDDSNSRLASASDCNVEVCGNFTGFLFESCCYDYRVTNDTKLVTKIMEEAEKEDKIQNIIANRIPIIEGGRNRSVDVEIEESTNFTVNAYDEDEDDNITATLERNDDGLFDITSVSQNSFGLSFAGAHVDGTFKGQMVISDATSSIMFTASVNVIPPPCLNDNTYRYQGKKGQSCMWVGMKEGRRQGLCSLNEVRTACRMTCGLCCKDDKTFTYKSDDGFVRNCAWTGRLRSRLKRYCKRIKISSNCPITCRSCKEKFNCIDKENIFFRYKKQKISCEWIGRNESRRQEVCRDSKVRDNCPTTCGLCCEDRQTFLFKAKGKELRSCAWVAEFNSRIRKHCSKPHVKANCPSKTTCNACQTYVRPR